MEAAYRDMIALQGEDFAVTSPDASEAVAMRGMYDRRNVTGEIRGSEVRDAEYQIGVTESSLPAWVGPGSRVDIRADTLQVTALERDGQGLVYLVCRAAR